MKRFYKNVRMEFQQQAYYFFLDDKPIKTPLGSTVSTVSKERAEAILKEWEDQQEKIQPISMPITKYMNTVHDKIMPQKNDIIQQLLAYAHHDCIFYLADEQQNIELFDMQIDSWLPIIQFYEKQLDVKISWGNSFDNGDQDQKYIDYVHQTLIKLPTEDIAGIYTVITSLGSVLLAIHAYNQHMLYGQALSYSRLEEDYNISKWGLDQEAKNQREALENEYKAAVDFLILGM